MKKFLTTKFREYYISPRGNVFSKDLTSGRICLRKLQLNYNGYYITCINNKTYKPHRLVAEYYVPNPDCLETVDHIDGDKTNNKVSNIQWLSRSDSTAKSFVPHPKGTVCLPRGVKVNGVTFNSISSAAKHIAFLEGKNVDNIRRELRRYLNGQRPSWTMYGKYLIE